MQNYQISITRAKSFFGSAKKYKIEVDGVLVGRLENGQTIHINAGIGTHSVNFLYFGRTEKSIEVAVSAEQRTTSLFVKLDALHRVVVSNSDQPIFEENKCTGCGDLRRQATQTVRALIIAFVLIVAVGAVASTFASKDKADTAFLSNNQEEVSNRKPTAISAENLWAAYSENTVNADKWFKGQTISVTGTITDIGQDAVSKKPCVSLDSGEWLTPIQCFFIDSDQTEPVAELKDGQEATIVGECTGVAIAHVQLTDCYISD